MFELVLGQVAMRRGGCLLLLLHRPGDEGVLILGKLLTHNGGHTNGHGDAMKV